MKLNRLFYFFTFLITFSSMSLAMNEQHEGQNPLEEFQKIVRYAFQAQSYDSSKGLNLSYLDSFDEIEITDSTSLIHKLHTLSNEMITHLFTFIVHDEKVLTSLGRTCKFFYEIIAPHNFLNDYCLQEIMPHAIPVDILVRKTKNTKDGVFKLANLYSVSAQDLSSWFGQPYLKSILILEKALPEALESQTEEQLNALHPLLKVTIAAKGPSEPFREQLNSIEPTTIAKQRLLSVYEESPLNNRRVMSMWEKYNWLIEDLLSRELVEAGGRIIEFSLANQQENYESICHLSSLIEYVVKIDQDKLTSQLKDKLRNEFASCEGSQFKVRMLLCLARLEKEETEKNNLTAQATALYDDWKNNNGHEFNESGQNSNGQWGFPAIYFYSDLATVYFYLNQQELCKFHYHNYIDKLLGENEATQTYTLNDLQEKGLEINAIEDMKALDSFCMIELDILAVKNMFKKING